MPSVPNESTSPLQNGTLTEHADVKYTEEDIEKVCKAATDTLCGLTDAENVTFPYSIQFKKLYAWGYSV